MERTTTIVWIALNRLQSRLPAPGRVRIPVLGPTPDHQATSAIGKRTPGFGIAGITFNGLPQERLGPAKARFGKGIELGQSAKVEVICAPGRPSPSLGLARSQPFASWARWLIPRSR